VKGIRKNHNVEAGGQKTSKSVRGRRSRGKYPEQNKKRRGARGDEKKWQCRGLKGRQKKPKNCNSCSRRKCVVGKCLGNTKMQNGLPGGAKNGRDRPMTPTDVWLKKRAENQHGRRTPQKSKRNTSFARVQISKKGLQEKSQREKTVTLEWGKG